ncbi:MAG: hypothetical protein SGILL_008525 [Bacillariaceae sp.]
MVRKRTRTRVFAFTEPYARTSDYNLTDGIRGDGSYGIESSATTTVANDFFFSGIDNDKTSERWASRRQQKTNGFASESPSIRVNGDQTATITGKLPNHEFEKRTAEVTDQRSTERSPSKQTLDSILRNRTDSSVMPATNKPKKTRSSVDCDQQDPRDSGGDAAGNASASLGSRIKRIFRPARTLLLLKRRTKRATPQESDTHVNNLAGDSNVTGSSASPGRPTLRRLWRRRHARTLEEGIRRERTDELLLLMNKAQIDASQNQDRNYVERTLMGVLNVLAEEIEDLDIDISANRKSPLWRKEVEELRINFSRLGFRPIRMGGTSVARTVEQANSTELVEERFHDSDEASELSLVATADEGFSQIDEDNSGFLDRDELAQALGSISPLETDRNSIDELASELLLLYDTNGDGVVDRDEYQQMVEDMARLRAEKSENEPGENRPFAAVAAVKESIQTVSQEISKKAAEVASAARDTLLNDDGPEQVEETETGSIVLSDLNLDLRRLVFGAFPIVKKVTPGGPLILEPFTATVTASFTREDVMGSFLLDVGLRRLVARALRVRLRSFRDVVDGALFFGRRWKLTSKTAPVVEVLGLSNVEFDSGNKMVITGRARIRTSPDAPVVTNTFKVRTKVGTRKNGHVIRLVEPELAFVFECPEPLDRLVQSGCRALGIEPPKRPEPIYSFFPIYSPFKVDDDNGGFDMGEDNCIRSIDIRNGRLQFEMSVVLRPGRFLGNHYVAFTLPMRTFIITMDRVWEGIRAARENKKVAARAKKLREKAATEVPQDRPVLNTVPLPSQQKETSPQGRVIEALKSKKPKPKSFFSRFVEGYTLLESQGEAKNERLTSEISDWFGRQGENTDG